MGNVEDGTGVEVVEMLSSVTDSGPEVEVEDGTEVDDVVEVSSSESFSSPFGLSF